ncbi:MAG: hypothetical protein OXC72_01570 [Roseovarius sp.]|nr:hypothetical protein [Roseovarius sp.]
MSRSLTSIPAATGRRGIEEDGTEGADGGACPEFGESASGL